MESKILVRNQEDDLIWEKVKNVPKLTKPIAAVCSIFNVILPGTGTIIAACMTEETLISKTQVLVGFMQFLLSILIIGYFWSWYWAYLLFAKSFEIGEFATNRAQTGGSSQTAKGYNPMSQNEGVAENNFLKRK